MFKRLAATSLVLGAFASAAAKGYVYQGPYIETWPFDTSTLSYKAKGKSALSGSNDDIRCTKAWKVCNPHSNPAVLDYYEKEIDAETTKKILAKYKSNDELLGAMQTALFTGPTFWPHRFVLGKILKSKPDFNRVAGYIAMEPELQDTKSGPPVFGLPTLPVNKKLTYVWDYDDIVKYTMPMPPNTIVFGLFDVIESGTTSNGGFFSFSFGSSLAPVTSIHRVDYYVKKGHEDQDHLVFRLTNTAQFVPASKEPPVEMAQGFHGWLHEFMTRTLVLDMVRGVDGRC